MPLFRKKIIVPFIALLCFFLSIAGAQAVCYSNTKNFDPSYGISWSYYWNQTIIDLPIGFAGISATLEIRVQVWGWPSSGKLDILCSDTTNFYAGNPDYIVGIIKPSDCPNPSNFYTLTFILKPNQIAWLTNDQTINFAINNMINGVYYLEHCKVTVCGSAPITHNLTIKVTGKGNTTPTPGSHTYNQGTVVTLAAMPASHWRFKNWTGDVADSKSANTTITINGDKTVTANFCAPSITPSLLLLE